MKGPKAESPATADPRPDVSYTNEGGGTVARCTDCGWETWRPDRLTAQATATGHKKCRAEDLAFTRRRRQARKASRR